ncbi:MAG: hypothetical protein ACRDPT_01010, partial [Streptomycetales bacterium]
MIPCVVALGQERIDLATNELDQRQRARRWVSRTRSEAISGLVVQSIEHGISERRRRTDLEEPRRALLAWPGRLEGTATSG